MKYTIKKTVLDTWMVVNEDTGDWVSHHLFKLTAKLKASRLNRKESCA